METNFNYVKSDISSVGLNIRKNASLSSSIMTLLKSLVLVKKCIYKYKYYELIFKLKIVNIKNKLFYLIL